MKTFIVTVALSMNFHGYHEVNDFVNKTISYLQDVRDEWQSPNETLLKKTGDCEDYALLKYALLKDQFPNAKLAYSMLMIDGKAEPHVVVLLDNKVLDNYNGEIKELSERQDLRVAFALDESRVYVDGKETKIHPCDLKGISRLCK